MVKRFVGGFTCNKDKIMKRFKDAVSNEEGSLSLEQIVWVSVILVLATAIWLFRDAIKAFIEKATGKVNELEVE